MTSSGGLVPTTWTAPGAAWFRAVRAAVADLQGSDPLREVAVVVPPGPTAIALRRALPRHHDAGVGVAAVVVTTAIDLAHRLAGPALAARRPVTRAVQLAMARRALADGRQSNALALVRDHPATLDAVADLTGVLGPLSWCTPAEAASARNALGGPRTVARELVEVAERARASLVEAGYRDEALLLSAAAANVEAHATPVVVALADELAPMQARFLEALVGRLGPEQVRIVAPAVPGGDEALALLVTQLGGAPAPPPVELAVPAVVSLPDADEECRHAVRHVASLAANGVPLDRIAVVHPAGTPPHARTLRDELSRAGVAWHGRASGDVAGTLAGQVLGTLLGLLDPDGDGTARVQVFALLALAPVTPAFRDGVPVPIVRTVARWEALARRLGVVTAADWALAAERLRARHDSEQAAPGADERREQLAHRQAQETVTLHRLVRFVRAVEADLGAVARASDWAGAAGALRAAWHRQVGTEAWRQVCWAQAPTVQRRAASRVRRLFEALAELDRIGEPFDVRVLVRTARALLGATAGPASETAAGVLVVALPEAGLLDVDHVVVVGMNDGLVPPRPQQGLLVPDGPLFAGPELPVRRARRAYRLLTAGVGDVVVTWARSDLRQGGLRFPSPWLAPGGSAVASHAAGVLGAGPWLTPAERLARSAAAIDDPAHATSVVAAVAEGHRRAGALVARLGPPEGPHDGDVTPGAVSVPDGGVSATWLEAYAACPFHHFVRYGLGVRAPDDPVEIDDPTARDRGSLVHAVLADLVQDWLGRPEPRPPWPPPDASATAERSLDRHAAELGERGLRGHPAMWAIRRAQLLDAVARSLAEDQQAGRTPWAAELAFGTAGATAAALALAADPGTVIPVRGAIDRVEVGPDGRVVVTDFKSGRPDRYPIRNGDPTAAGRLLQLPLYGLVAAREHEVPVEQVTVQYRFVGRTEAFPPVALLLDAGIIEVVHDDVRRVVAGVAAGRFRPSEPAESPFGWDCPSCVPDGLGGEELAERVRRSAEAPT